MAKQIRNPSAELEDLLRDHTSYQNPEFLALSGQHKYHFTSNPLYPDGSVENLRYIKYEPITGIECFATGQIFDNCGDAIEHWKIQKRYDARFVMHPQECVTVKHDSKVLYMLIFPKVIRDISVWIEEHAKGQVSDVDMWEVLKKTEKAMRYLSVESHSRRSHGNLLRGIGIAADLNVYFFNFGADKKGYNTDIQVLDDILTSIEPKLVDPTIQHCVTRWKSFLSMACSLSPRAITPPLFRPFDSNHVRVILHYPASWDDEEKLRFLANIHKLCTDKCNRHNSNLMNDITFDAEMVKKYSNWGNLISATTNALSQVFQFGCRQGNYLRTDLAGNRVLWEASVVVFAHNSVKHYSERAQWHNNRLLNNPSFTYMPELISSQVLDALYKEFSEFIEDIYEAFYKALENGYRHHMFNLSQILSERL